MLEQSFKKISEEEISLKEAIDFLVESWKIFLLGGMTGGLIGLGYAVTTPAKYQATANIQVAKVANIDVEAPAMLVEKLKMPTYYSQKTYVACKVMDTLEPGEVISGTLKPTLAKTAPIVTISYIEKTPENAKNCLASVLDDVRVNQALLANPLYQNKINEIANLKLNLESVEEIIKFLPNKNNNFDFSDSKFSAATLLLATTLSKENEIKDLRTKISDLEIALIEPQTKEASLVTPIFASQRKVSPKTIDILATGFFGGLFLGLMFVILKRGYRAYKVSNQN